MNFDAAITPYEYSRSVENHSDFYQNQSTSPSILCVEIGHTRLKATRLSYPINKENLRNVKTIEALSAPWLKHNLHELFTVSVNNPLNTLLEEKPSHISLSIFGPVYKNGHYHCITDKLPENIVADLQSKTYAAVEVEVDTAAWAVGAMEYLSLNSQPAAYPALVITLGTGVGMALIENETKVTALEYWAMNCELPRLKALNDEVYVLNKRYLDRISNGEEFVEEKMKTYRPTYNSHFQALAKDMCEHLEKMSAVHIKTVLVGGGYSRFIDDFKLDAKESIVFNPAYLEKDGVSPDIIQLLGCLRKSREPHIETDTLPAVEVIEALIKPK